MTDETPSDQTPQDTKALDDFLKKRLADIERDRQFRAAAEQQYAAKQYAEQVGTQGSLQNPLMGGLGGYTEQQMRSQCLQFAVQTSTGLGTSKVIENAQAYFDFLTGKPATGPRLVKE